MTLSRLIDTDRNRVGVMAWVSPGAPQLGAGLVALQENGCRHVSCVLACDPNRTCVNASCDHCRRNDEKLAG